MDLTTVVIAIIASLIIGAIVGALLTRALSPQEQKRRELEEKLQAKDDELKTYQRDVSDHFIKTSQILVEMRRNQQEIAEQLATSAIRLTSPEVNRQIQDVALRGLDTDIKANILSLTPQEAPKDYAPSVPGGVLNESYGLTDISESGVTRGLSAADKNAAQDDTDEGDPTFKVG